MESVDNNIGEGKKKTIAISPEAHALAKRLCEEEPRLKLNVLVELLLKTEAARRQVR